MSFWIVVKTNTVKKKMTENLWLHIKLSTVIMYYNTIT